MCKNTAIFPCIFTYMLKTSLVITIGDDDGGDDFIVIVIVGNDDGDGDDDG